MDEGRKTVCSQKAHRHTNVTGKGKNFSSRNIMNQCIIHIGHYVCTYNYTEYITIYMYNILYIHTEYCIIMYKLQCVLHE